MGVLGLAALAVIIIFAILLHRRDAELRRLRKENANLLDWLKFNQELAVLWQRRAELAKQYPELDYCWLDWVSEQERPRA